jgi:hypothetical protein
MWLPNILVAGVGIVMLVRSAHEQRFVQWERLALLVPGRPGKRLAARIASEDRQQ